jgi:hypothetical protein
MGSGASGFWCIYEKRWNRLARPVGTSWRVSATQTLGYSETRGRECPAFRLTPTACRVDQASNRDSTD